jgi:hypothetical protein
MIVSLARATSPGIERSPDARSSFDPDACYQVPRERVTSRESGAAKP